MDALIIAQYSVGLKIDSAINPHYRDLNCDDQVNIVDVLMAAQYSVGLIVSSFTPEIVSQHLDS